ncbi:MAG: redoxin domain-containing protein [Myxococcales bacterium]|nr:redoxin domain-containing protein [Myxococcales bacterium]
MRLLPPLAVLLLALPSLAATTVPWLGIEMAPGSHGGVAVRGVAKGSPAQRAKIVAGDQVLAIDQRPIGGPEDLLKAVQAAPVGAHLKLLVVGKRGERTIDVTLEARPAEAALQRGGLLRLAAPDFVPKVRAGAKFAKLSALKGQVVLLDFYATWCGPCLDAIPRVEKLHEAFGGKGLKVIGISTESAAVVAASARTLGMKYSLVSDEDEQISARYRIHALPTLVVIDRKGMIQEIAIADVGAADRAVRELLK